MILFLPGFLCTEKVFEKQLHTIDGYVANYGNSKTIKEMAETVANKYGSFKFDAIISFSMGGYVAIELLNNYMISSNSVVFINTTNVERKSEGAKYILKKYSNNPKGYVMQDTTIDQMFHNKDPHNYQILRDMTNDVIEQGNLISQSNALATKNKQYVNNIDIPALVITSTEDKIITLDDTTQLHRSLKNSYMHIIENAGHMTTIETPYEVNNAISSFIFRNR